MVTVDHTTDMVLSSVVPKKGAIPYSVLRLSNDIALLGHVKLILRSGNESSALASEQAARAGSSQQIDVTAGASRERSKKRRMRSGKE